jgi:hypothetical protein
MARENQRWSVRKQDSTLNLAIQYCYKAKGKINYKEEQFFYGREKLIR